MRRHRSLEDLRQQPPSSAYARRLNKIWTKYRRVTMSDMQSIKMAEDEHKLRINHLNHNNSNHLENGDIHNLEEQKHPSDNYRKEEFRPEKRNSLVHRNSWPSNHNDPISPRGPMKSHIGRMKEELPEISETSSSPTSPRNGASSTSPRGRSGSPNGEEEIEGFPDPEKQLEIISNLDTECTCTYAVSKMWYGKWEEYCGAPKGSTPGNSEKPCAIEMDTHNDGNNEYISEAVWQRLVRWYGVAPSHQLDRKHQYFKDEKAFDVCILSPFSGIVEHNIKKFNRFEEIGYIECQLRRIFHVPDYKKSRIWISEKAQVPRFRQLLLRFRMLNDCIHRDKVYILALEECSGSKGWPTGEPGEPKGDLTKYRDLISGPLPEDYWSQETKTSMGALQEAVSEVVHSAMENFLTTTRALMIEKETSLESTTRRLNHRLEETTTKETLLTEQEVELSSKEAKLQEAQTQLEKDREEFEATREKFQTELKHMESMHRVQETKIKLDVGGQIYTTSIQTLRQDPDSMLAAMFSGRYELKKESDGSYFIDRDGTFFRYILNFLRDGYLDPGTLPSDPVIVRELHREAKYCQLSKLVDYLDELLQANENGK